MRKRPNAGLLVASLIFCGSAHAQSTADLIGAAEKGDAVAEYNLGEKFEAGEGVEKNSTKYFCWMHRSAEHGYLPAWLKVGMSYGMGTGVQKDDIESYKWFHLVDMLAPPNWPPDMKKFAIEDAALIAKQMSPAQVDEAKLRAQAWWDAVKARGHPAANQQYVPFPGDKPAC